MLGIIIRIPKKHLLWLTARRQVPVVVAIEHIGVVDHPLPDSRGGLDVIGQPIATKLAEQAIGVGDGVSRITASASSPAATITIMTFDAKRCGKCIVVVLRLLMVYLHYRIEPPNAKAHHGPRNDRVCSELVRQHESGSARTGSASVCAGFRCSSCI